MPKILLREIQQRLVYSFFLIHHYVITAYCVLPTVKCIGLHIHQVGSRQVMGDKHTSWVVG